MSTVIKKEKFHASKNNKSFLDKKEINDIRNGMNFYLKREIYYYDGLKNQDAANDEKEKDVYNPILAFGREQEEGFNFLLKKPMELEAQKNTIAKIVTSIELAQAEYQEKTGDILSWETIIDVLTAKTKQKANATLNDSEKTNPITEAPTRLNDLGLPMHPLEIEVAELVERAKKGEQVFPKYQRADHGNPVAYLKEYYGDYLKIYNKKSDYLYQDQLTIISPEFKETLRKSLLRDGKKLSDYITTKSNRLDGDATRLKSECMFDSKKHNRINSLVQSGRF